MLFYSHDHLIHIFMLEAIRQRTEKQTWPYYDDGVGSYIYNIPERYGCWCMSYAGFLAENADYSNKCTAITWVLSEFFQKERLYPCHLGRRESKERHFWEVYFQEWLNRLEQCDDSCCTAGNPGITIFASFAAGAMLYVVVEELIPEMSQGCTRILVRFSFALGFSLMMILDVALGKEECFL